MEKEYTLTAELRGESEQETIYANSDGSAVLSAISHIMDLSHTDKQGLWALGRITLSDSQGNVLNEMAEKTTEGETK